MEKLKDPYTGKEMWRITHTPEINTTHLYHNVEAFSANGRFLAFGDHFRHAGGMEYTSTPQVFVYDFAEGRMRGGHAGAHPVWNPRRNELVFSYQDALFAWDLEADAVRQVAQDHGLCVGSVERQGRWALCFHDMTRFQATGESAIIRVPLDGGDMQVIFRPAPGEWVASPRANPCHDVCVVRFHGPTDRDVSHPTFKKMGLNLTCRHMMIMGTDGSNPHPVSAYEEWGHHCWSGDGEWYIIFDMCRRWNARPEARWQTWCPMPVGFNHPAPCGRDGRLLVGDYYNTQTAVYNLQTHELTLMNMPMSSAVPYAKNADPHPIGSPDGTKYVFDSMYDLARRPITRLSASVLPADTVLPVESAQGFPESGHLILGDGPGGREIVAYARKEPHRFLDCRRGTAPAIATDTPYDKTANGTTPLALGRGEAVIDYDGLHLKPGVRREPDVYVQVIRPPQHPIRVRAAREQHQTAVTWQPPRNSLEFQRYEICRRCQDQPWTDIGQVSADTRRFVDPHPPAGWAAYAVRSVEYSGLRSALSAEALTVSPERPGLPRRLLFPVGEATIDPDSGNPERQRIESLDHAAYNHLAVMQSNCGSPLQWVIEMPCPVSSTLWVHARTVSPYAASIGISCNGRIWTRFVDASDYAWVCAAADDHGAPVPVTLNAGDNILKLHTRGNVLLLDALRLELTPAPVP